MAGSIGSGSPQKLPVQPAADHPDTGNYPTITGISATRVDATTIIVNWTTDKPTIGFAAAGAQSQVGQPSQVLYPVWSPIENFPTPSTNSTYQTSHSATISNCPAGLLLHYTAVAKDLAGNSVYASDQIMPAYISPDGTQITSGSTGAVYNRYGKWTFGPVVTPPTGAGPPGPYGNFQYVKLNGKVLNNDNVPVAQAIRVDFGGNVFFLTTQNDRWWFQFVGYESAAFFVGSPVIDPTMVINSPAPPTTFNPPYTPSADGTTILGGSGSLTTADGVFTFGPGSGNWPPYLNGTAISVKPNNSNVLSLKVSAQGNLFAQASNNSLWYAYLNFNWYPAGASVTAGPIPLEANLSVNLRTDLHTTTSIGTVVATISVRMSDGSPFSGTMSVAGGSTYVGVSGSAPNYALVTVGAPVIGAFSFVVTATQNGVATSSGASGIDIVVSS